MTHGPGFDGGGGAGASGGGGGSGASGMGGGPFFQQYWSASSRQLDLLFMVDNSSSMEKSQEKLRANFPRFMDELKRLPDGMPDVHIAVISSDMGAGRASADIPNCNAPDNGVFKFGVGVGAVGCTSTGLDANQRFISSTGGNTPITNFGSNDITKVFQCIAPIGAPGCGYEHQLSSVVRALGADGFIIPPENTGFLRPDAYLGIVLLTNEDDCSSPNPDFYMTSPNSFAAPRGPSGNFRCAEFGHLCTRGSGAPAPPQRNAPNGMVTDTISYDSCVSAEGQGELTPVETFAAQIKMLKIDPANQILVASIQGPATPYQIHWKAPALATDPPWPDPTHSCTAQDNSFADPGVRIQQFVQQFGANGLVSNICEDNFGPALGTIGTKIGQMMGPNCFNGLLDKDPALPGLQPNCMVREGNTSIPACADNGNALPCWSFMSSSTCPANGLAFNLAHPGGTPPSSDASLFIRCEICDPRTGCP